MFIIPSGIPTSSAAGAYVPAYALQFDGSADYLSWIPSQAGNRRTWTFSAWVKRSEISNSENNRIFSAGTSSVEYLVLGSGSSAGSDQLELTSVDGAGNECIKTTAVYRDPSAWMHIVVAVDTTNATGGNRARLFVNGTEVTAFATDTNPTQNVESHVNNTVIHALGVNTYNLTSQFFDGYMADVIFLDGIASTDASAFGETDSTTGIWVPKDPTDSDNISDWGGQNSFYLNFADGNNLGKDAKPTAITAATSYAIDGSGKFDGSTGLLQRTASSGNQNRWTVDLIFKFTGLGVTHRLFEAYSGASDFMWANIGTGGELAFAQYSASGYDFQYVTTQKFRDTGAWYNLCIAVDTTKGGASDRVHIYLNGIEITDFSTESNPSASFSTDWNAAVNTALFSRTTDTADADRNEFNGYGARFVHIDGLQLTPSSFGGFNDKGIWIPSDCGSGLTYGTNGFLIEGGTDMAAGTDSSGETHNFAKTGTITATTDSPTNTAGDNEGNFATFNSLLKTTGTFSNGNLKFLADSQSGFGHSITSTHVMTSGTYYAEFVVNAWSGTNHATIGIATTDFVTSGNYASNWTGANTQSWGYYADGSVYTNGSGTSSGYTSYGIGDVIGVKLDATNGAVYFYKDGTVQNSGSAAFSSLTGPFVFSVSNAGGSTHTTITANFGQTSLSDQPGSTSTLGTHNLPAVTIDPRAHFAPVIYTGTGFSRTVRGCFDSTGTAWTPDLVWLKNRDTTDNHAIWDSVRGVGKAIHPNLNVAEQDNSETNAGVTAFNSGGFSLGNFDQANTSTEKYVAWSWKIGGSPTVENDNASGAMDDGSVFVDGEVSTSYTPAGSPSVYPVKMSINTTTKMSLLTYKAGSASSIPHGLGVKPNCIFIKNISSNKGWRVGFFDYDGPTIPDDDFGFLDSNGQFNTSGNTDHLASGNVNTFSIDGDNGVSGNASWTHLAWCMASVEGFSKFGTYTGNGDTSANGPFIYLGFKPSWVMLKRTDAANNWGILDASRNSYNPVELVLYADLDQAEAGSGNQYVDFTSNGFKIKNDATANWINASSGNYVYAAFAETPFASNNRGR